MKKNTLMLMMLLVISGVTSCKKHHTPPGVPAPTWTEDETGKYPASMTAVLRAPDDLTLYVRATDKIGAFIGGECRGVGRLVKVGDRQAFFVLIHGTASEQSRISFRYWNARRSAMYQTDAFLDFKVDGNYGTADGPEILDLKATDK